MMQGAQSQGMQSNFQAAADLGFENNSRYNPSGFLQSIQEEDLAIRNRGLSVANVPLMKELSLFFGIQLLVLAAVAIYHFYF